VASGGSEPEFGEFEDLRRRVDQTGEVAAGILRLPSGDAERYLEYGIVPAPGPDGAVASTIVTVWDVSGRIAAERASRRHARRLKLILDAAPIPLTVIDSNGIVEIWNPAAEQMSGLAAADVVGRHPENALPGLSWLVPTIASLLPNGPVHDLPIEWQARDGTRLELSAHCALIDDPDGALDAVVGAAVDVGPLRERERSIARLNRIYEVLTQIDGAIFSMRRRDELLGAACRIAVEVGGFAFAWIGLADQTGNVRVVASHGPDPSFLSEGHISVRPHEPAGAGPLGTAIREDRPIIVQDVQGERSAEPRRARALARGYRSTAAFPIHQGGRAIGAMKLYSPHLAFFDSEEVRLLSDMAQHLSFALESLETERLRGQAETRYRTLFESNPQAMWVFDLVTRRIVAINEAAVSAYGYTRDEFLAMTPGDVLAPESGATESSDYPSGTDLGQASMQRHLSRDGRLMEVEISGHEIEFDGRRACVSLINDVTERRQLEARLRDAAKIEAVGQLAGGIAHDFNNVLAAVIGYADLLVQDLGDDPRAQDAQEIGRAGRRAADLTRQLLAFARRQVLVAKPVDVNEVVAGVVPMLRRLIGEDITLSTHLAASPAIVVVDPSQLEQVLVNLAVNARDAMPNGGRVEVDVAFQKATSRRRHHLRGPSVLLTVSDTGTGMSQEVLSHVFEPFFTTKASKGTGLGLATVHGIVSQSGGEIWVESTPAKGTTFSVLLPQSDREAVPVVSPIRHSTNSVAGATILVVEDEPDVRRFVVRTLEHERYTVLVAGSPGQAEALAASGERIDLVLTDLVMPGVSGAELAKRLLVRHPQMRVLYMSGYDPGPSFGLTPEQMVGFLAKPFGPEELTARVRDALSI
jgi:PAS domain S-box-containing protein